jgi:fatty acid desaturase
VRSTGRSEPAADVLFARFALRFRRATPMNRAIAIVVVPALLVAAGYLMLLRALSLGTRFWPLLLFALILAAAILLLARRVRTRAKPG